VHLPVASFDRGGDCENASRGGIPYRMEVTMALDDMLGADAADALTKDEAHWLDRVPPELEWDESEEACLVEDLVAWHHMRDDN
jgi:hypothetical protein